MALVKEYHFPNGTVQIFDDAYRDASPEELRRRKEYAQRVAGEIMYKNMLRELKAAKD